MFPDYAVMLSYLGCYGTEQIADSTNLHCGLLLLLQNAILLYEFQDGFFTAEAWVKQPMKSRLSLIQGRDFLGTDRVTPLIFYG